MLNMLRLPDDWSTIKKLIWLRGGPTGGEQWGSEELTLTAFAAPTLKSVTKKSKVTACTVSFSPSQDLHGYDSPWPAGGGKNLCYDDASHLFPRGDGLSIVENADTFTAYAKVATNTDIVFSCETAPFRNIAYGFESLPAVGVIGHVLEKTSLTTTSYKFNSGSYPYVGFYYGATDHTNTKVMIEQGASASSYSPYSNICPISGWQGAEVYIEPTYDPTATPKASVTFGVQSANKWDEEWELGSISNSTGQNSDSTTEIRCKNYIPVNPGTDYCFVIQSTTNGLRYYWYKEDYTFISSDYTPNSSTNTVVRSPANAKYLKIRPTNNYGTTYLHNIAINYPSTVTTYNPYRDYILGGTAEIVSGTGSAEWAVFDGGDYNWTKVENSNFRNFYCSPNIASFGNADTKINAKSEAFKGVTYNGATSQDDNYVWIRNSYEVCVKCTAMAGLTEAEFKTLVTGVKFFVRRSTSTPYTFPPASSELILQKGDNYNWATMTNT